MSNKSEVTEDVLDRILVADTRPEHRALIKDALEGDKIARKQCEHGNVAAAIVRLREIGQSSAALWLDTCRRYAVCA